MRHLTCTKTLVNVSCHCYWEMTEGELVLPHSDLNLPAMGKEVQTKWEKFLDEN